MLGTFLEENPSIARKIVDKCINSAIAREAARKASQLARRKTVMDGGGYQESLLIAVKKMLPNVKFSLLRVTAPVEVRKWAVIELFRQYSL